MSNLNAVREHYDEFLAEYYDWMFGTPVQAIVEEQKVALQAAGVKSGLGGRAVDLGCGSGFQSLALRELGYEVLAIDTSEKLLTRLADRAGNRGISTRLADIRGLDEFVDGPTFDVAVCMGDTLPHLPQRQDVPRLFDSIVRALKPGGRFVLSYRDLARSALTGSDRFILVRGDAERVMTCFLEYRDSETVTVTDLIHVRNEGGGWGLRKSSYTKLRLDLGWVRAQLQRSGFTIAEERSGRMCTIVAAKPWGMPGE